MSFLKHVGKQGDRKVAIIFREVPGEPHMCLVTYTETLNQHIHDPLIRCIESDIGQHAESLSDALNRTLGLDGNPILQTLHREGLLKKVNTENIVVTPNSQTKIKLNELNKILTEMKQGEEAVKRMADIDQSRGLQTPSDVARRMREQKTRDAKVQAQPLIASSSDALGDSAIANNLRQQAARMAAEAKGLMAESQDLLKQAAAMDPPVIEKKPRASKKAVVEAAPVAEATKVKKPRAKVSA
jgi:glutamyl/glutaminyl-tRNA synthetase